MEPKVSLPHSQVPATCPYPEPDQSSPYPRHPTSWRCILILYSHLCLGSPKWSLSLRFPHQSPVYASPLPHTCYIPRPSHSSRFDRPNSIGSAVQIINPLVLKLEIYSLAHHSCEMWIFYEPRSVTPGNTRLLWRNKRRWCKKSKKCH